MGLIALTSRQSAEDQTQSLRAGFDLHMVKPAAADDLLRAIAAENNLSETAFLVLEGERWRLRWFTPTVEVDLDEDQAKKVFRLIEALEDSDDVQDVYANYSVPDEVMEKLG